MATTLSLRKWGRAFVLDGLGTPNASLEFGRGMATGTITVGGKALPIHVDNPLRSAVTLGGDAPVLRLGPHESYVPGSPGPVRRQVTRSFRNGYRVSLVRAPTCSGSPCRGSRASPSGWRSAVTGANWN